MRALMKHASILLLILLPLVNSLPPDFVDEEVAVLNLRGKAIGFNFVPKADNEGHVLLICGKEGQLVMLPDPDVSSASTTILDLSDRMCSERGRGLYAVVAHPDFLTNRYIYLFYTFNKYDSCRPVEGNVRGPVARVSRFIMRSNYTVDRESEFVLLDSPSMLKGNHHGGDLAFGKDGALYVTIGDGGDRRYTTPSQNVSNLLGSVLRLTDDGGIPLDNPFTSRNGYKSSRCNIDGIAKPNISISMDRLDLDSEPWYCEEVYAFGLRNPYRFAFDPNTPDGVIRAFINDVGSSVWEETNELESGANYGWPELEGPCPFGRTKNCGQGNYTHPVHFYQHGDEGAAAVGLAFVPNGLWPDEYDNSVLLADYVLHEIYLLTEDISNLCLDCTPPKSGWIATTFHDFDDVVQLTFGPFQRTQALYYLSRASGGSHIRRIYYAGGENKPPVPIIVPNTTTGSGIVHVNFDGSNSTDPDGDVLSFYWDFGDGSAPVIGSSHVNHTYVAQGVSTASLTVSDPFGLNETATVDIKVGIPPIVFLENPRKGTEFAVGDVLTLSGFALDSNLERLPPASLEWEVRQHHNTHYHPFLDRITGDNILLQAAPSPEDFLAATNSHLEVILTATDDDGIKGSNSRVVIPRKVTLEFDSEPSGLTLVLDDFTVTTPIEVVSWENHQLRVEAPKQTPWQWVSWSDRGSQNHPIQVPPAVKGFTPKFVAMFELNTTHSTTAPSPIPPSPAPSPTDSAEDELFTLSPAISGATMSQVDLMTTGLLLSLGMIFGGRGCSRF